MATKIKGICKGFKYISQIFVVKEREMEIGYPTDVKHVAHIGWDGPSGTPPSWMNEFKTAPSFSTTSSFGETRGLNASVLSALSAQGSASGHQTAAQMPKDNPTSPVSNVPNKQKRKKTKSTSSPKSSSSSRHSRTSKSKATLFQTEATAASVQLKMA